MGEKKKPAKSVLPAGWHESDGPLNAYYGKDGRTHPQNGRRICGKRKRRPNRFGDLICLGKPTDERGLCKFHGGTQKGGPSHPNYKHGRYSKALPDRLVERYNEATKDRRLLSLRDDVALLQVRIQELVTNLHTGESGTLWSDLQRSWEAVKKAGAEGDSQAMAEAMKKHSKVLAAGNKEEAVWRQLIETIERKTNIARAEHSRLKDLHQMMTVEEALGLVLQVYQAIVMEVEDLKIRGRLSERLIALLQVQGFDKSKLAMTGSAGSGSEVTIIDAEPLPSQSGT